MTLADDDSNPKPTNVLNAMTQGGNQRCKSVKVARGNISAQISTKMCTWRHFEIRAKQRELNHGALKQRKIPKLNQTAK